MAITIIGAGPESEQKQAGQRLTKMIRVGGPRGKLAVLAVDPSSKRAATTFWHVARPGSWDATQESTGYGLVYATSLCRRQVVTNGYAADFAPPEGTLCPACKEQL